MSSYSIALVATSLAYGQVTAPGNLEIVGQDKNTFLDASGYTDLADKSAVKGLNFPRTDLTKFKFNVSDLGNYQYSKTAFDGMIVYNIGTGTTGADKNTQGEQVNVEPGFYFFYHPTATEDTNNVSKGRWVRIGDDYSATPNYVAVGTFVHDGGNSAVLSKIPNAADFKAINLFLSVEQMKMLESWKEVW